MKLGTALSPSRIFRHFKCTVDALRDATNYSENRAMRASKAAQATLDFAVSPNA
jgi:hypothetical protein